MMTKRAMMTRSYSQMIQRNTFEDRYNYLRLRGSVGRETFGFDRYLNQRFYKSVEWKRMRDHVISRDNGCDLAVPDHEIYDKILIHHMNPMVEVDIVNANEDILNPEYLVCTSLRTHNAIHYGDSSNLLLLPPERRPGDTRLW